MKKLISASVILLFIGVLFAPSIDANVGKSDIDASEETIPLELHYHQIIDKIKSINMQNILFDLDAVVDTIEEISITLEENDDLRIYAQMQSDCGCSNGTFRWSFPAICYLLGMIVIYVVMMGFFTGYGQIVHAIMYNIGIVLNCFWTKY